MVIRLCVFLALCVCIFGAPEGDKVTHLPGLDQDLSFDHYSGYLDIEGTKKHFHYWFTEAQKPEDDTPLLLWLNGGPGCSSVSGLLTENGPFRVNRHGDNLKVSLSPTSWNLLAHTIFLESPAGVGFSYSDDKTDYHTNDETTASDNYHALLDFFKKFPEHQERDFYIAGESYGGIYVPTLAKAIVDGNKNGEIPINLKGVLVGNGLASYELNDNSVVPFAYYHGLIGLETWTELQNSCDGNYHNPPNQECAKLVNALMQELWEGDVNIYDITMDCHNAHDSRMRLEVSSIFKNMDVDFSPKKSDLLTLDPPCIDSRDIGDWLNNAKVMEALHVRQMSWDWAMCSDVVQYDHTVQTVLPIYDELLEDIRVLIYNGDTDMACNFLGDQWAVEALKRPVVQNTRAWHVNGQVAGFVKEFDQISFTTIKGTGHMAPQYKGEQCFYMLKQFLENKSL